MHKANRYFLDDKSNINYLRPYIYLKEKLYLIDSVNNHLKQDYKELLSVINSNIKVEQINSNNSYNRNIESTSITDFLDDFNIDSRLFMLNEAHNNPTHRLFATLLLKKLYDSGFRYFAVEGLSWNDSLINNRKFPISKSGYYIKEPNFGNLIRTAIEIGYTVLPYEQLKGQSREINSREQNQANNIIKYLNDFPESKIFIYAGYSHIQEKSLIPEYKWMAERIKDSIKVDPITIDQTTFDKFNNIETSYVINTKKSSNDSIKSYRDVYDFVVTHPQSEDFLHILLGKKMFLFELDENLFNTDKFMLLQVYKKQEYNSYNDKAIPIQQKLITNKNLLKFYLKPKTNYTIIIKDEYNKIYYYNNFNSKKRKNKLFIKN